MQEEFCNAYLEGDSSIVALYRNLNGVLQRRTFRASWDSFHLQEDITSEIRTSLRRVRQVRGMVEEGRFVRIQWSNRFSRDAAMNDDESPFRKLGIPSFEADVDPVSRWLVDERVRIARPRRCYVDVETDSRVSFAEKKKMRLLCWSLSNDDKQVFARGQLETDTDADEKRILEEFWRQILSFDQVVCWNGSYGGKAFDFEILEMRSEARGVKFDMRLWHWVDQLPVFATMNAHAAESGAEKASMRLGDIAQELLGEGKESIPDFVRERFGDRCNRGLGALAWDLWEAGGEFRALLFKYNEKDTVLLPMIEGETGYLGLLSSLAEACGIFPDARAVDATRRVDGFMLRLGAEEGHRFPTRHEGVEATRFRGAIVGTPTTLDAEWRRKRGMTDGIARDVHVVDFSGMYPSIMISWNMSPETRAPVPVNGPVPPGFTRSPLTGIGFRLGSDGFLVKALRVLMEQRAVWNKKKADCTPGTPEAQGAARMSDAYKIAINSFYGVVGSPFSRYFDRSVAESVTQNGVWLITRVIREAEERGWDVIYYDTDGAYIIGPTKEEAGEFAKWCTQELFPKMVSEVGCTECAIKLAYEKQLGRIVFTAAKRYCASILHFKGSLATSESKPEVKGIEYKRGDTSKLARHLQTVAIDMLVGGLKAANCPVPTDDLSLYHGVLGEMRRRVLEDPLSLEDVRASKSLSKSIREYVTKDKRGGGVTEPPAHVRIAKILKARGRAVGVGTRIEYVVTDGSKSPAEIIPAEDYDGLNVDRYHVWESVVFPPTERLLQAAYPDHDWSSWGKVRPPKPRGRAQRAEEAGQISLGYLPAPDLSETRGAIPAGAGRRNPEKAATRFSATEVAWEVAEYAGLSEKLEGSDTSKSAFRGEDPDHDPEVPRHP